MIIMSITPHECIITCLWFIIDMTLKKCVITATLLLYINIKYINSDKVFFFSNNYNNV